MENQFLCNEKFPQIRRNFQSIAAAQCSMKSSVWVRGSVTKTFIESSLIYPNEPNNTFEMNKQIFPLFPLSRHFSRDWVRDFTIKNFSPHLSNYFTIVGFSRSWSTLHRQWLNRIVNFIYPRADIKMFLKIELRNLKWPPGVNFTKKGSQAQFDNAIKFVSIVVERQKLFFFRCFSSRISNVLEMTLNGACSWKVQWNSTRKSLMISTSSQITCSSGKELKAFFCFCWISSIRKSS